MSQKSQKQQEQPASSSSSVSSTVSSQSTIISSLSSSDSIAGSQVDSSATQPSKSAEPYTESQLYFRGLLVEKAEAQRKERREKRKREENKSEQAQGKMDGVGVEPKKALNATTSNKEEVVDQAASKNKPTGPSPNTLKKTQRFFRQMLADKNAAAEKRALSEGSSSSSMTVTPSTSTTMQQPVSQQSEKPVDPPSDVSGKGLGGS